MLRWFNESNKALAIVTANAKEGGSYLAANLAVMFSQLGERTSTCRCQYARSTAADYF